MLEVDPIATAQTSLLSVAMEVMRGGDPNKLRGPLAALLRAKGQGKQARELEALPPVPYVKPKPKK